MSTHGPLINGRQSSSIEHTDRGLQYGDGLFETIRCEDGQPRWLVLHFDRLRRGLTRLQLSFDAFDALQSEIAALAAGHRRCLVKVLITRGVATRRGYAPRGNEQPTRIVSCHEWPARDRHDGQFRVGLSSVRLGLNPLLAGLKHLNRLEQVLAQQQMTGSGLHEVLMLSANEQVIGGSMSNAFFADEQGLFTPQLRECGVEGVMRRVVLDSAVAAGIAVCERGVSVTELARIGEAFVTNVRLGVQSVTWFEGRSLQSEHYAQLLRRQIDATPP